MPLPNPALHRAGLLCGLLAAPLWAATIFLCGRLVPGFDHFSQYISELGERGSPTELLMRYAGFVATGVLHIVFAATLHARFGRSRLAAWAAVLLAINGLARIGAGFLPCEPGCADPQAFAQRLHGLAATTGFLAIIGASLLWGLFARKRGELRRHGVYSITTALAGLAFLGLMVASEADRNGTGLYERLASGVLSLWVFVTAAGVWHRSDGRRHAGRRERE